MAPKMAPYFFSDHCQHFFASPLTKNESYSDHVSLPPFTFASIDAFPQGNDMWVGVNLTHGTQFRTICKALVLSLIHI